MRDLKASETHIIAGGNVTAFCYGQYYFQIDFHNSVGNFSLNTLPGTTGQYLVINMGESNYIDINGTVYPISNITLDNIKITTYEDMWGVRRFNIQF